MKRLTPHGGAPGVPLGLPDYFYNPVIELDPDSDASNRQLQAFESFTAYARELTTWLDANAPGFKAQEVTRALGTTMSHFLSLALTLPSTLEWVDSSLMPDNRLI